MTKRPPFQITSKILALSQSIARELGTLAGQAQFWPNSIQLRRENKIKTIHASLSIEGNPLTLEQVTDILSEKKVMGTKKDIAEIKNAEKVYENLQQWNPLSLGSLKKAHELLMSNLVDGHGEFRSGNVGIFKNKEVVHVAPQANNVPRLMHDLFEFITTDATVPWLIKACVFHYELEFIHPFTDGNGRIGRLWQQLLLMKEDPVFELVAVETIVKESQQEYYEVLGECDKAGDSTMFIEFSLGTIFATLKAFTENAKRQFTDVYSRLARMQALISGQWFTRKEYIESQQKISTATASRDLQQGVTEKILEKSGFANQSKYRFTGKETSLHLP